MEPTKERLKLKEARRRAGLSQPELAKELKVSTATVSLWERGQQDPQPYQVRVLCDFFKKEPEDLDINIGVAPRRQVLQMIVGAGVAGALMSFEHTSLSPEEFLIQCNAAIDGCWQLIGHNGATSVENILLAYIPTLSSLTMHPSHIQKDAASLATQLKFLQAILASRKLDYKSRELLCLDAVRLAKLSGSNHLQATALEWYGDTYTSCLPQPQRAIELFTDGISRLNSDMPLSRSALCSNLAIAYGKAGDESKARSYVEEARKAMPKHPELDPFYQCIDFGLAELDGREGRMYLDLAGHLPNSEYAQKAYDAYGLSLGKQATNQASLSTRLIRKAEAACILGDFRHYAECLNKAMTIAFTMDSKKQKQAGISAIHKAPESWHKEKAYQDLVKQFA